MRNLLFFFLFTPLLGISETVQIYLSQSDYSEGVFTALDSKSTDVSGSNITFKLTNGSKAKYKVEEIWGFTINSNCLHRTFEYMGTSYLFKASVLGEYMLWAPYAHFLKRQGPTLAIDRTDNNPVGICLSKGETGDFFRFTKPDFEKEFDEKFPGNPKILPFLEKQNGDGYAEIFDCGK